MSKALRLTQEAVNDAQAEPGKRLLLHDTDPRGLKVRITESGIKSFVVMFTAKSGARRLMTLDRADRMTLAQARTEAKKLLGRVAAGEDPAAEVKAERAALRASMTLSDFVDGEYAPFLESSMRSGAQSLRRLRRVFAFLMDTRLDAIDRAEVMRLQNRRANEGTRATTINRDIAVLRACLSHAVRMGVLDAHPLAGLRDRKNDSTPKVRFLDTDEVRRLFDALHAREKRMGAPESGFADHLLPMVLLVMNTGIRRGECFSLEWRDVDLDLAVLTVRAEVAKSGKARHVPLNATALDALTRWRRQSGGGAGYVFASADGKRFGHVGTSWRGTLRTAGIKDFRFHDLRHHFASKLVMGGVDLNTVRELLGHADYKMVLVYAHLSPEHKRAAVQVLERTAPGNVVTFPSAADGEQ